MVFNNQKNKTKQNDSHLIMQELIKSNLKTNVIQSGLEKHMRLGIKKKLSFIDSFQFLCFSLDSLVKNVTKDDSKYFSKEFDNNVLYLVKQNGFYRFE